MREKLLSRVALVGFAIILQILLIFALVLLMDTHYKGAQVIMSILGIIVLITIVNRDMSTEAKIPWIILVLIAPLPGTILYILFSGNHLSREHKKRNQEMVGRIREQFHKDLFSKEIFNERLGKYTGQCTYIHQTTGHVAYGDTNVTYLKLGEEFLQDLLSELEKAKKYIFMEYFIIEPGQMWDSILSVLERKVKENVEVCFMYDDLGSVSRVPADYDRTLREKGIQCIKFNPFKPIVSETHNNRDHRKITVIDGLVGFMGGANLADEYINTIHPFGHWKDTAVKLNGKAVKGLILLFMQGFNMQHGKLLNNFADYIPTEYPEQEGSGTVLPYGDGPRPAYIDYIAENVFLNMIGQAERYLWITTPYLILDNRLQNALCNAAQRGVDVRIVTPHIPDKKVVWEITHLNYQKLQDSGVKIFEYTPGFIHAKQFLCDDEVGIVGTINLDYRSLVHHFECGVWMHKTECLKDMKEDFEQLFHDSLNMYNYRQNPLVTLFCRIIYVFVPLL